LTEIVATRNRNDRMVVLKFAWPWWTALQNKQHYCQNSVSGTKQRVVCVRVNRHNVQVWLCENPRALVESLRNNPKQTFFLLCNVINCAGLSSPVKTVDGRDLSWPARVLANVQGTCDKRNAVFQHDRSPSYISKVVMIFLN